MHDTSLLPPSTSLLFSFMIILVRLRSLIVAKLHFLLSNFQTTSVAVGTE
jgi:hypothetical protein